MRSMETMPADPIPVPPPEPEPDEPAPEDAPMLPNPHTPNGPRDVR